MARELSARLERLLDVTTRVSLVSSVLAVVLAAGCGGVSDPDLVLSPLGQQGREVAADAGCTACHGDRGQGSVGPAWAGLSGATVELDDGTTVVADDAYLHRSITDPAAEKVTGYTIAMPDNALSADEIDAVVAYIQELE